VVLFFQTVLFTLSIGIRCGKKSVLFVATPLPNYGRPHDFSSRMFHAYFQISTPLGRFLQGPFLFFLLVIAVPDAPLFSCPLSGLFISTVFPPSPPKGRFGNLPFLTPVPRLGSLFFLCRPFSLKEVFFSNLLYAWDFFLPQFFAYVDFSFPFPTSVSVFFPFVLQNHIVCLRTSISDVFIPPRYLVVTLWANYSNNGCVPPSMFLDSYRLLFSPLLLFRFVTRLCIGLWS